MDLEVLMGRYHRLQRDLATAYRELPWRSGMIDRIADELAATESELLQAQEGLPAAARSRYAVSGLRPSSSSTARSNHAQEAVVS